MTPPLMRRGGLLAAALVFFSHQGHQVFHDPCPDLEAYRWTRGVVSSIVPVDRLLDHILSSVWVLLEGLFAPLLTDSGPFHGSIPHIFPFGNLCV